MTQMMRQNDTPDMLISAVLMRIFCKRLDDGRVIAPMMMYDLMEYWQNCPPRRIHGERKILCSLPLECDGAIKRDGMVTSLREMAIDVTRIPVSDLFKRREFFLQSWETIVMYTDGLKYQVGISQREFDHLEAAFGHGPWMLEVLIEEHGR